MKKKEFIFIGGILILALAMWGGMSLINKGSHGSIRITVQCPDHLCMKQKAIDEKGGTIVCLPNKVVIEGEKSTDSKKTDEPVIDAVT